jgi:hypothetical protein
METRNEIWEPEIKYSYDRKTNKATSDDDKNMD